jgi:hypothetical protein
MSWKLGQQDIEIVIEKNKKYNSEVMNIYSRESMGIDHVF